MNAHATATPTIPEASIGPPRISKAASFVMAAAFVVGIGWLDYVTGDFSLTVFYLLPVILATWYGGRGSGLFTALWSAGIWLFSGLLLQPAASRTLLPYWNAAVAFAVYATVVQLLFSLRRLQTGLEHRVEERTTLLLQANTDLQAAHQNLIETRMRAARQEKMASLGILAAGVAHEIRNPLTALKTLTFTLRKKLGQHAPAQEDARIIDHEIDRLDRIVSDFRLFARPGDPSLVMVGAHELLGAVCGLLAPELARSNIGLTVESGDEFPALCADPQQLQQVLINLVRNAAESIGQNGRIVLRARRDRAPLQGRSQEVTMLEVQDTGGGIPAEVQERLFDPFFTTKPAGTGLGLSIAMRILERHGGTLQFQTAPGRGTTFGVVLPSSSAEPPAAGAIASQRTGVGGADIRGRALIAKPLAAGALTGVQRGKHFSVRPPSVRPTNP